jgi:hypothetical protein
VADRDGRLPPLEVNVISPGLSKNLPQQLLLIATDLHLFLRSRICTLSAPRNAKPDKGAKRYMFQLLASRLQAVRLTGLTAAVFCFGLLIAQAALMHAQTSDDNGPVTGKVAPGQNAAVEGTTKSALYGERDFPVAHGCFSRIQSFFAIKTVWGVGW